MTTTYFTGDSTKTHYIKELPLDTGTWSTGVTSASQNGTTGTFSVATDDAKEYMIYEQQGGSPAASDVIVGYIPLNSTATDITAMQATLTDILNMRGAKAV